ncbi:MAG: alpha-1,2-fucosyltransferase, partial [Bacteroidota bacterium]|nr:alpha-1,2-fucosyltransferase [Bacteroidota bacterium]
MDDLVITRLKGGLGNQMFQFAVGKHLSLKNGTPLLLDLSFFDLPEGSHTPRKFGLDAFGIEAEQATQDQLHAFRCFEKSGVFAAMERSLKRMMSYEFIIDHLTGYQPETLNAKGRIFLDGYWQSEKYFLPIEADIRRSFIFTKELLGADLELAEQMQASNSVSIHIRRGDY